MSLASALEGAKSKLKPTTTIIRPHPCIATGVQQFGKQFLGDAEASKELDESEADTIAAAQAAAALLRSASCVVVHTGAGIATAAGVGDFRGKNGVWTQLSKGIIPDDSFDITECLPSFAHMAVKGLVDAGIVKDVVSTNHDGLHMKSGLTVGDNLHELHGNVYVERCVRCFKEYKRRYPVLRTADRYTGRDCPCGGRLWDSGIDFGQTLPQGHLHAAQEASKTADVHVVLGSSLQVAPSSFLPRQYGAKLILVTKGVTPADGPAGRVAVRSYGRIDRFMESLLDALGVAAPKVPTLEETGYISIKMLLKRRWGLRAERVRLLQAGEPCDEDTSVPPGWSRHVDEQSAGIDYWFHSPSNQISFGRPVEPEEAGTSLDSTPSSSGKGSGSTRQARGKGSPHGPPPPKGAGKSPGAVSASDGDIGCNKGDKYRSTGRPVNRGCAPGLPPAKGAGKSAGKSPGDRSVIDSGIGFDKGRSTIKPVHKGCPPGPPKGVGKACKG